MRYDFTIFLLFLLIVFPIILWSLELDRRREREAYETLSRWLSDQQLRLGFYTQRMGWFSPFWLRSKSQKLFYFEATDTYGIRREGWALIGGWWNWDAGRIQVKWKQGEGGFEKQKRFG